MAGGASRYVHEIFRRLAGTFDITVLSEASPTASPIEDIDHVRYVNIRSSFPRLMIPFSYLANYSQKADVLVDNGDVAIPWLSPLFVRIPKIALIHQLVREIFYYELPRPVAELGFFAEPKIYRLYRATRIVAASKSTAEGLVSWGIPRERISVIRPGTASPVRDRRSLNDRNRSMVCCVSRLMRYKGIHHALRAMRRVLRARPEARLVVIGSGPYQGTLRKLVDVMGLAGNVEFVGRVSDVKKLELLSKSRVMLMPSVREGYGMSVIEANSVGTPVIGWNVPGLRDSICDDTTGLLAPWADDVALSDRLIKILSDDDTWNRLSENAQKWSMAHSWDRSAAEFKQVIEETISERHRYRRPP